MAKLCQINRNKKREKMMSPQYASKMRAAAERRRRTTCPFRRKNVSACPHEAREASTQFGAYVRLRNRVRTDRTFEGGYYTAS